jgi:hypothetical protein
MLNKTYVDAFSKLQSTVETATFGSEYVAARTCTEQIIALRFTLRYLGVPINSASNMFGDNESVVNTASFPHSRLMKRHNALSYHRTREAIAAKILRFYHVKGTLNPADILSKHWDMASVWTQLRPLLFWRFDNPKACSYIADPTVAISTTEGSNNASESTVPRLTSHVTDVDSALVNNERTSINDIDNEEDSTQREETTVERTKQEDRAERRAKSPVQSYASPVQETCSESNRELKYGT